MALLYEDLTMNSRMGKSKWASGIPPLIESGAFSYFDLSWSCSALGLGGSAFVPGNENGSTGFLYPGIIEYMTYAKIKTIAAIRVILIGCILSSILLLTFKTLRFI